MEVYANESSEAQCVPPSDTGNGYFKCKSELVGVVVITFAKPVCCHTDPTRLCSRQGDNLAECFARQRHPVISTNPFPHNQPLFLFNPRLLYPCIHDAFNQRSHDESIHSSRSSSRPPRSDGPTHRWISLFPGRFKWVSRRKRRHVRD